MPHSVQMPALGESVTEGTVTRWLKNEGDQVTEDEPLLEVSTDKVDTEVPAPYSGVLERILVREDETVEVGAELAVIGDGSGVGAELAVIGDGSGVGAPAAEPAAEPVAAQADDHAADRAPADEQEHGAGHSAGRASDAEDVDSASAAVAPASDAATDAGEQRAAGTEITMPAMGESVTEGTVTRWLKQVGERVAVDEPLLEISTDKVDTEVPSPAGGTVLQILVQEDETVEVGTPLAVIGGGDAAPPARQPEAAAEVASPAGGPKPPAGGHKPAEAPEAEPAEQVPAPTSAPEPEPEPPAPAPEVEPRPGPAAAPSATGDAASPQTPAAAPAAWHPPTPQRPGTYVTPVVRKLAADQGVDLADVVGTGVGGRIRREDVLTAAQNRVATAPPAPAAGAPAATGSAVRPDAAAAALIGTTQKTPRIRQVIARNMLRAVTTSAQLTTVVEVDVTRVAALRQRARDAFEAREGVPLSFLPFFVKAAVESAKAHPVINSSLSEDLSEITYHPAVNMGIAVDTPRGLIVPVIHDADDLNIAGLARRIADLADRTRANRLGPDELAGGTLSLTNTGSVGALFDTAIFVPPQSAIVVTGAVVKRPVVVTDADGNDVIAVRSMAHLALSYDHRTIDGADAARYLTAMKTRIEGGDFEPDLGL